MMSEAIDAEFVEQSSALAVREGSASLALPIMSPDDARAAMSKYLEICAAVLGPEDYQSFTQWDPALKRKIEKKFKKKSAVKKLQTFWGVSVSVTDVQRDAMDDGHFGFRCVATATARDGRKVDAAGACSTLEDRFMPERKDNDDDAWYEKKCRSARARAYHDVLSTAETRATNRAVMNCIGVGGGEVTADEISRDRQQSFPAARPPVADKPLVTTIVERAISLGIIAQVASFESAREALKAHVSAAGVPWTITAVSAYLDAYRRPAATSTDAQRRLAMTLFGKLGYDESQRHDFYESVCGYDAAGEPCRSWASVARAGKSSRIIDALQEAVKGLLE